MKALKRCFAILLLSMGVTINAHALPVGIEDHDAYLTDTTSGLDWLDVTASVNMSYDYVSGQLGSGGLFEGWRYATAAEFGALLSNSGITDGITGVGQNAILSETSTSQRELIALLGDTFNYTYQNTYGQSYCELYPQACPDGDLVFTRGLLSDSNLFRPSYHHLGIIYDEDRYYSNVDTVSTSELIDIRQAIYSVGSFLVRDTASVPEASTLMLLGIGLLGLVFSRRKHS